MDSRYEEPDGGVDCAADHGSVPLGFGTTLSGPRLGPRLWLDRKASPACDGHSRQTHCTSLAVAERFCRTIDWVHSPRVPGPHDRPRRGSPAPVAALLRKLLQRNQNASRASERRADPPPNRADWYPEITSDSRRTSSPIRPNVVFGTHRPARPTGTCRRWSGKRRGGRSLEAEIRNGSDLPFGGSWGLCQGNLQLN